MMGLTEVSGCISQTCFEAECQTRHQHFTAQHNQKSTYQLIAIARQLLCWCCFLHHCINCIWLQAPHCLICASCYAIFGHMSRLYIIFIVAAADAAITASVTTSGAGWCGSSFCLVFLVSDWAALRDSENCACMHMAPPLGHSWVDWVICDGR